MTSEQLLNIVLTTIELPEAADSKIAPKHKRMMSTACYELGQKGITPVVVAMSDVCSMMDRELDKKVRDRATIREICFRVANLDKIIANQGGELIRETAYI